MNLAILIDAENVLPASADLIFNHAFSLGSVLYKEIYGAATALTAWVGPVLKYAIHPNLTIKAAKGKNSSDIALVIGAMDMLLAGDIDGVIIASSDSDFSALSIRLRNAGIEVIGMGTDKANELWRTACSSFVVLQPQKAQSAPAKVEAPQQPAPRPSRPGAAKPAGGHQERAAAVKAFIMKQLSSRGGRMQTGMLFPMLNRLPEYQADKKGSGKKPLNYLTSTFGDAFSFEESADGNSWVSLPTAAPLEDEAPAAAAVEVEEESAAPVEEAAEQPVEAPVETLPSEDEDAPRIVESGDGPDPLALLVEAGLAENVAAQIVSIFTQSANQRAAYNRLRSVFGSTEGRRFYQLVKEIASRQ